MINGSIEIHVTKNGTLTSIGKVVTLNAPAEAVQVIAAMGYTGITPGTMPASGPDPLACWTATAPGGHPAIVRLWRDIPFDETEIGRKVAAGILVVGSE